MHLIRRPKGIFTRTVSLSARCVAAPSAAAVLAAIFSLAILPGSVRGQISEQADVERIVRTLAALEPQDLQGLEAVVGPLNRDTSIWEEAAGSVTRDRVSPGIGRVRVDLAIDPYREEPREVANPRLASYEIVARMGEREAEQILKDRLGKPRRIRFQGRNLFELGSFYLDPFDDGGFRLLWYAEEPDFAIPPRPRGVEERLIRDLVALIEDGFPRDRIERRLGRFDQDLAEGCEVIREESWEMDACPAGAEVFDRIVFRFRPALPGYELTQALGIARPVVVSTDVHQLSRVLADREQGFPTIRGYAVEVEVKDRNLVDLNETALGLPAWRATTALVVDTLRLDREPPSR